MHKISYANCWEDADILLKALNAKKGSAILSIASAGDNSFSLLTTLPSSITLVDMNPIQLHLCELKMAAFNLLSHAEVLCFLGINESNQRAKTYHNIKHVLSKEAQVYWDTHIELIESGIVWQGKFEKYFKLFRKKILPLIHSKNNIKKLFATKSEAEQLAFYNTTWNNWRWKLLFKLFFSKLVMGRLGRKPEYLNQVDIPVADFIYNKAQVHLSSTHCQTNYFLSCILQGNFGQQLPHYLRPENFEIIKQNIDKIILKLGVIEDYFVDGVKYDVCNFSNIFEYMDADYFKAFGEKLKLHLNEEATIAYWNLMVNRRFSTVFGNEFVYNQESKALTQQDKGFFYNQFISEKKS